MSLCNCAAVSCNTLRDKISIDDKSKIQISKFKNYGCSYYSRCHECPVYDSEFIRTSNENNVFTQTFDGCVNLWQDLLSMKGDSK
jgi:hypothetical protein